MTGRALWCAPDGSYAVITFEAADGSCLGEYVARLEQMSYSDDSEYFREVFTPGRLFINVFEPTPKKPRLIAEDLVVELAKEVRRDELILTNQDAQLLESMGVKAPRKVPGDMKCARCSVSFRDDIWFLILRDGTTVCEGGCTPGLVK
jgi:hypothetical protein